MTLILIVVMMFVMISGDVFGNACGTKFVIDVGNKSVNTCWF